jgi:hypothetical protein
MTNATDAGQSLEGNEMSVSGKHKVGLKTKRLPSEIRVHLRSSAAKKPFSAISW